MRDRVQPREDSCNRVNEAAKKSQGCAEIHRMLCIAQPIPRSVGRKGNPTIPTDEENGEIHMGSVGRCSFQGAQAHALQILAASTEKEPTMLYIAATTRVVSVVMVVERPKKDKA